MAKLHVIGDFTSANFVLRSQNGGTAIDIIPNRPTMTAAAMPATPADTIAMALPNP